MVYCRFYELWALAQIVLMSWMINACAAVSRGTQHPCWGRTCSVWSSACLVQMTVCTDGPSGLLLRKLKFGEMG